MTANEILTTYATLLADEEALRQREVDLLIQLLHWCNGEDVPQPHAEQTWHVQGRKSRVLEIVATLRRYLTALPLDQQQQYLAQLHETILEITRDTRALDLIPFEIDWSRGEKPVCPCHPLRECPLLFLEIGYHETQQPGERATPAQLAQCPRYAPRALVLRGVFPHTDFKRWWQQVKQPGGMHFSQFR